MTGRCMICQMSKMEIKHLPLYVRGSEGLDICHFCEMILVEFVREIMNIANRSRLVCHKDLKGKKNEGLY